MLTNQQKLLLMTGFRLAMNEYMGELTWTDDTFMELSLIYWVCIVQIYIVDASLLVEIRDTKINKHE